tara:strand:+ start:15968 stop:16714 length:747 start_codon:yes stop_codon:yes gene_type:complete
MDTKKIALITGGASGIGLATVNRFTAEGIKTIVFDSDINNKNNAKSDTNDYISYQVDVSNHDSIKEAFAQLSESSHIPTILVNCAGISPPLNPLHKYTLKDWQNCLDINLTGTFLMCKEFMNCFIQNKLEAGAIVNISSIMGSRASAAQAVYSASKHGVVGITKSIAQDYAGLNIRANAVGPGAVKTPMTDSIVKDDPNVMELMNTRIPMKRFAKPEEISNLIYFLASDESSYITGSYIPIDGGYLAT